MIANLSGPTMILIVFVVLLLFGAPKLPALARSLGQSMKILRKETNTLQELDSEPVEDEAAAATATTVTAAPDRAAVTDSPKDR